MKTYPKMKDSEIEWIGEIPEDWEINRLQFLADITTGEKDTVDNEIDGDFPFFVRSPKVERISSYSYDEEAVLTAGDGVGVGTVIHYVNGKFDFHQRVYKMNNFRKINGKYFYYYFKENFKKEVLKGTAKSTVPSLRKHMLQNFPVVFGSEKEQEQIIKFLEKETSEINLKLVQNQKLVELLKIKKQSMINQAVTKGLDPSISMKDSGIEWIGEIPEHWETKELKKIIQHGTSITYGIVQTGEHIKNGIPCIRTSDMKKDIFPKNGYIKTSPEIDVKFKRSKVYENDIVVAIRATVGKAIMVPDYLNGANLTQGTAKISPNEMMHNQFVLDAINSESSQQRFHAIMKGATFKEITLEMLRNFIITCPPLEEQKDISKYIDSEIKKIDKLISNILSEIKKLQEYRQVLITSAITGKIDVREAIA